MSDSISTLAAGALIPHGYCYLWERGLVWLHAVSDTLIAASYFSLPAALIYFVHKRRDIAFKSLFVMFGVFILACGLTHVMGVWTIWVPAYWLDGGIKAVTAAVSLATAVMIWPLIPKALALPSPAQLQTANRELQREVTMRAATEHALRESEERYRALTEALEAKVRERTTQLRDAQEELIRKEKLAVLGQVAGSMGHELRNPLGVMNNAVYFLKTVLTNADATTKEYLDIIGDEIMGADRIVSDLLDSVHTKPPQPQTVEVADLIRHTVKRCTIPEHVEVIADLPSGLPPLTVDPQQMRQVFRNLLQNSLDAMSNNGCLRITAAEDKAARTVRVSVRDTGCGIRPEHMAKLFQPLFTTKARGTGLGLVVVKKLTEANGGTVEVQSTAGEGTVFTVVLPAAPNDAVAITQMADGRAA